MPSKRAVLIALILLAVSSALVVAYALLWAPSVPSDKYVFSDGGVIYIDRNSEGYECADVEPHVEQSNNTTDWIVSVPDASEYKAFLIRKDAIIEAEKHCRVVNTIYKGAVPEQYNSI